MTAFEGIIALSVASQPLILYMVRFYLTKMQKTTDAIHVAVNSERARMMNEINALKVEVQDLKLILNKEGAERPPVLA